MWMDTVVKLSDAQVTGVAAGGKKNRFLPMLKSTFFNNVNNF